ncbi:BTBD2-like protein [Mya arenaria]|uniref:BTBD2-like protein n=1 Tax=Mya arenaria TaxID=6604 RepID=A0ABY7EU61_MYAAR|nr:BTB/POZ domain-containing protein 2-like [Mya arenaria]WAR13505.1 BTBD2-like protein [Mya arenaria]
MAEYYPPEQDWQSTKPTISECSKHMWTHKLACDITFNVGPNKKPIQAHRYVLMSRSCVFYEMLAEQPREGSIEIPDVTEDSFNLFMQYLYYDDFTANVTGTLGLLRCAKKYKVQGLINRCLLVLKNQMDPKSVCSVLESAHVFNDEILKNKCLKTILYEPLPVLESDSIGDLCSECFAEIISRDDLAVPEEKVFDAVLKYAKIKCRVQRQEELPDNVSRFAKDLIKHVRLPLTSLEYFSEVIEPSGLLAESEALRLYRYFARNKTGDTGEFSQTPRKCMYEICRFKSTASGWGYKRDNVDGITFESSENIQLRGIQLYGTDQGPGELKVTIRLVQQPYRAVLTTKQAIVECNGKQKLYSIFFEQPKEIRKGKRYSFDVIIRGPTTFYGVEGQREVEGDNVKFCFSNSDKSSNNTVIERGQIPGLIFELPSPAPGTGV